MYITSVHGYGLQSTPVVINRDLYTSEICGDQGEIMHLHELKVEITRESQGGCSFHED